MEVERSKDDRIDGMNEGLNKSLYVDDARAYNKQCVCEIVKVNGIGNGPSLKMEDRCRTSVNIKPSDGTPSLGSRTNGRTRGFVKKSQKEVANKIHRDERMEKGYEVHRKCDGEVFQSY